MGGSGRWVVVASILGFTACAPTQWLRGESAHFVVYSDAGEATLRDYALRLEDFDAVLRLVHRGAPDEREASPRKLEIYLVGNTAELSRTWPNISASITGEYTAATGDTFAIAIRGLNARDDADSTVFHEYVHHFMLQYFPYPYPVWLVEGWAEYFMPTTIAGASVVLGRALEGRTISLVRQPWLPMADLLGKPLDEIPEAQRDVFYAQAWALTHFLLSDPERSQQLDAYMRAVASGGDPVTSMQAATGLGPQELERALVRYLRTKLSATKYRRQERSAAAVTITALPASAGDLILEVQRMKLDVAKDERSAFLAMIRTRAAAYPGDRFADLALARAEVSFGDRAAGAALLDRYLAANADDVDALELRALGLIAAGKEDLSRRMALFTEARPYLGRAFQLDPNRYQTLFLFALSKSIDADYPTENTLNVLLSAHQLAPQVDAITFFTAEALARRRRFADAIALLAPLANDPHGGKNRSVAKELLAKIRAETAAVAPGER